MIEHDVEEMSFEAMVEAPYTALYNANVADFNELDFFTAQMEGHNRCGQTKLGVELRTKLRWSLEALAEKDAIVIGEQSLALATMRINGHGGVVDTQGGWALLNKTATEADDYWRYHAHRRGNYFYYVGIGCVKSYYYAYCHLLSAFEYRKLAIDGGVVGVKRAIKRLESKMTVTSIEKAQTQVKKLFVIPNLFA